MTEIFGIYFAALNRFIWFPLFFGALILLFRHHAQVKKLIKALTNQNHQKNILQNVSTLKQTIKILAYSSALFFIFIALLQPQWNKKDETITQEGRDLLIALDISRSMLSQDSKPNRLESVKLKIKALLQKLQFERVGLILFSGSAIVQCPLTVDYATFLLFLDQVDVETIASGTTAIDTALTKAMDLYKQYPDRKNKLVLLATDGEDFSLNLNAIEQQAKQEGIKVFTLGIGSSEGAPIPKLNNQGTIVGSEVDETGNIALSKLNESLLQDISSQLDGKYIRSTYDDSDLDYLVDLIKTFEKEKMSDKKLSLFQDQYPWFLAIAWILLILEWIL